MSLAGYDMGYLRAGVEEMEAYLLSSEVYWPTGVKSPPGQPPYPQLTLGGVLLAQRRAHHFPGGAGDLQALSRLEAELEANRSHWRVAWEKKAAREFHARLMLWRDYLEEFRLHPENHADRYAYEVSRRVLLDLLQAETGDIPGAETELLAALDRQLQAHFAPGAFVWENGLQAAFPPDQFWYLYGNLRV